MTPEKVDLEKDYRKSGGGANGDSYFSLTDESVMLKLYNTEYSFDVLQEELEISRKVYELGIPSPEPGCLITDGKRLGIKFKRLVGKRSYARMIADEPERMVEYTREFARYCKQLHETKCPQGLFPDAKEQARNFLSLDTVFNPEEKAVISDFISGVPDCDTALHGDMHFGNAISTLPAGATLTQDHIVNFIDLGTFASGCPLFDFGMLQIICFFCDEEFRRDAFHITGEKTRAAWDVFVDEYFFSEDKLGEKWFGEGATPQTVYEGLKPYSCMKIFLIENNCNALFPHFEKLIRETFGFSPRK